MKEKENHDQLQYCGTVPFFAKVPVSGSEFF
jgi:hypothetical protein